MRSIRRPFACAVALAVAAPIVAVHPAPTPAAPPAPAQSQPAPTHSAVTPAPRTDEGWVKRNQSFNERAAKGDIDLLFIGDSITQGWEGEGKEAWAKYYGQRKAANFGIGGDRTQHVLWRLQNGNLGGLEKHPPKLAVVMIGTNNSNGEDNSAIEISDGIKAIVQTLRDKLPQTKVLLLGIFPRGEQPNAQRQKNDIASAAASSAADDKMVFYLNIGDVFMNEDDVISKDIMPDFLHLSPAGYEKWAAAIEPKVKELMGT